MLVETCRFALMTFADKDRHVGKHRHQEESSKIFTTLDFPESHMTWNLLLNEAVDTAENCGRQKLQVSSTACNVPHSLQF